MCGYTRLTSTLGGVLLSLLPLSALAHCPSRALGVRAEVIRERHVRTATASAEPFTNAPDSVEAAEDEADLAARALLLLPEQTLGSLSGLMRIASCFDGRSVYVTVMEDPELARKARALRSRMPGVGP